MGFKSGTPVPPAAHRGPAVYAVLAVMALCFLWASSNRSGGSGQAVQLGLLSWAPKSSASGVAFCTKAEAAAQAAKLQAALKKEGLYTACPAHKWLGQLPSLLEAGQDFVMFDIGCNKGYESASVFAVMDPETGLSPSLVHDTLEAVKDELKLGPTQGQCNDHKGHVADGARQLPQGPGSVTVHCFEPSSSNFRGLQALHDKFFAQMPRSRSSWYLHNMAVTNVSGTVSFPSECNTELCSVRSWCAAGSR